MASIPFLYVFLITMLSTLFSTAVYPQIHLIPFTSFFALVYLRTSLVCSLWIALGCGLLLDLIRYVFICMSMSMYLYKFVQFSFDFKVYIKLIHCKIFIDAEN